MSDVDEKLEAAWSAASREEPPAALDDALRAAARRAVDAGPSRARHMQSWPLAAAAIVAVLAVGIVQMAPPEQVTPTVVADNASPPVASKEKAMAPPAAAPAAPEAGPRAAGQTAAMSAPAQRPSSGTQRQLAQPSSSPPPKPSVGRVDKPQAPPASGAGGSAARAIAQAPDGDRGAPKSKLEAAADEPAEKIAAEPFPAAPAESRNAADALTAPPPTVAAAKPAAPTQRENAIDARPARRDEAPSTQGTTSAALAKISPEGQRAKDSAPRTPDEWIKLMRRLQGEGRKDQVAKELAAFRAEYKERANALLPADLRDVK